MIKRLMKYVAAAMIAAAPASAEMITTLVEEKVFETYEYQIDDNSEIDIRLSGVNDQDIIQISKFWMDKASGQFFAHAAFNSGSVKQIAGTVIIRVPVIVPSRKIEPGELIEAADLGVVMLPKSRVSKFSVTEEEKIVGMEAKRVLAPGRAIAQQSLTPPIVIRRGQKVSISFQRGKMSLTAPGQAKADASLGQEIKVINLITKANVVGYAKHNGIVEVVR